MLSKKTEALVENSSIIRSMFVEGARLKAKYGEDNVYDFSLGNPSVKTPIEVREAIIELVNNSELDSSIHGYMNNAGFPSVRKTVANKHNHEDNTSFDESNIIMTVGAAGGINVIFNTILNPDDEIIVFAPFFTEYKNYIGLYDCKTVIISADVENFQINFDEFEKAINPKTKAVIINSPNNPTGVTYSTDTIIKLSEILKAKEKEYGHEIYVISDEPYRELLYTNEKLPFITNYYDNSFFVYSYSKSLSLPGERIGYIAVSPKMKNFENVISGLGVSNRVLGFVNAPSLFQLVIEKVIDIKVDLTPYRENLELLYNGLTKIGYECIKPNGAFYLFPKSPIADDKKFVALAKEKNLLIVPGSAFYLEGYFRISYCTKKEVIEKALPVFEELFKEISN